MKKITLLLLVALSTSSLFAQETKFGLTAGFLNAEAKASADGAASFSSSDSGFYLGALVDIGLTESLHIQPEVLYGNINDSGLLYIPIFLKYYISESGFHLMGGPQATLNIDEEAEGINNLGIDAAFGLGYDIYESFFINARYAFELTNRVSSDLEGADGVTARINSLQIGVGYKF